LHTVSSIGAVEVTSPLSRAAAITGATSVLLLAAAVHWAHHWGPLADTIVAAWALSTSVALGCSILALRANPPRRGLARLGLALALVSAVVLCLAGLAFAAGGDPGGACGGG
jgi:hypothetical protein